MPILLPILLNFQGSAHLFGVGSFSLDIVLELNDIDSVDKEYVAYSETVHGFGNVYPKILFSSNEKIIIKRKE